jgi:hypothetical protein
VSLQSRDIQQLLGKLSKSVRNWRGKVFRAAAAWGRPCCKMATPQQKAFCILQATARNTFPRQLQTNFESFPDNCWKSRDCRLTGYFIICEKVLSSFFFLKCPLVYNFDQGRTAVRLPQEHRRDPSAVLCHSRVLTVCRPTPRWVTLHWFEHLCGSC